MNRTIKKQLKKFLNIVKKDKQILAVFLFGSVSQKKNHRDSDIDICLLMKGFCSREELLHKRIFYLGLFDMDIQIFQELPIYIRVRILKEGKILFCRNEDELYDIAFKTIQEYADFEHIYQEYLKEVADGR